MGDREKLLPPTSGAINWRSESPAPARPSADSDADLAVIEEAGDPSSFRASSTFIAFINLEKFFLGSGILALPYGFAVAGLWASFLLMLVVGLTQWWAMKALVDAKYAILRRGRRCRSLLDLGDEWWGLKGRLIIQLSVILGQAGVCVGYVAYVASSLQLFYDIDARWYMLMQLPIFLVLCQVRNLAWIGKFSLVGLLSLAYALAVALFYALASWNPPAHISVVDVSGLPLYIGLAIFAVCSSPAALQLEESMAQPQHFDKMNLAGFALTSILYAVFSSLLYLGFGDGVNAMINCNLPDNVVVQISTGALVFMIILTFPLQLSPVLVSIEPVLVERWPRFDQIIRTCTRLVMVTLCVILAVAVPSFALVSSLSGSVAFGLISFVVPPLVHWKFVGTGGGGWAGWAAVALNLFVLVFGTAACVVATVYTVFDAIEHPASSASAC